MKTKKSFKIALAFGIISGVASAFAYLNSHKKGRKPMFKHCKTRKEILTAIAKSASSEGLNVETILRHVTIEQMQRFNITVDDFILKHYEDPSGVLLTGALRWISIEDISLEEAEEIKKRTEYIESIWKLSVKVWNMNKDDENDFLTKALEVKCFKTWEQLECWLKQNYDEEGNLVQ